MNDDLDEEGLGSEKGFDEFSQRSGIGDIVRTNPMAKIGVVLAAVAIVVAVAVFFGGSKEEVKVSSVGQGSDVNAPPASADATKAYVEAVGEKNEENYNKAIAEGESNIPIPTETSESRLQVEPETEESEDPLQRWRKIQEETVARDLQARESVESVNVLDSEQQGEALKKMSEAMRGQMESILGKTSEEIKFTYVGLGKYKEKDGASAEGDSSGVAGGQAAGAGADNFSEEEVKEILIPAGEIDYAQTLLEANSDIPGPVMATLLSGPLKGSRIIGSFSKVEDYLTLKFERVVIGKQDYPIDAVAIDPETSLPGMATDVDHRYFKRIVLPAAAAFVEGFASAIAESGRTDVTVSSTGETITETSDNASKDQKVATGVEEAGSKIGEILDEMGDVETLVIIKSGTPIGVLFTNSVEKPESDI